jgi:hypothetical protein
MNRRKDVFICLVGVAVLIIATLGLIVEGVLKMNDENNYPRQVVKVELKFMIPLHLTTNDKKKAVRQIDDYFDNVFQSEDIPCSYHIDHEFYYEVK